MGMSMYEYVHLNAGACGGQEEVWISGARVTGACELLNQT